MIRLDKCCFCLNLQTGAIIIGSLDIIRAIIDIVLMGIVIGQIEKTASTESKSERKEVNTALFAVSIVALIIFAISIIVSSLLIHGARKERRKLLIPWMIVTIIVLLIVLVSSPHNSIAFTVVNLLIIIYEFAVVASYYVSLNRSSNMMA